MILIAYCPYDLGPICKHQVAAYYVLSEIINGKNTEYAELEEVTKQPSIKKVLDPLSREELIKIIVAIVQKDDTLKNSLIMRYSKGDNTQELNKCKNLIESIVRKYLGREGFITYRETYGFVNSVIELAMEGERQDNQYAGLVVKWKKLRYEAYKQLSLKTEQQTLAKELLFDGNFDYYNELKELSPGNEAVLYNSLIQELEERNDWTGRSIYLKLITQEKDLDVIMAYVRKNPESIEEYGGMLQEKFRDEVIEIYKEHIKAAASSSNNRRNYQDVCEMIKRYRKIAGKNNQETIINELSAFYKRRPAFLDELSKI